MNVGFYKKKKKTVFASVEGDRMFFILEFVNVVYHIDLQILKNLMHHEKSLHLCKKPHLIMVYDLFFLFYMHCLFLFFWRITKFYFKFILFI